MGAPSVNRLALLSLLATLALQPACDRSSSPGDDTDTGDKPPFGGDELIPCWDVPYQPDGEHNLIAVEMDEDEMVFTVNYSGGCAEHEWMLCHYSSGLAEWGPHYLALLHEDNEDTCETNITENLRFDVSMICESGPEGHEWGLCLAIYPDDCDLTNWSFCVPEEPCSFGGSYDC